MPTKTTPLPQSSATSSVTLMNKPTPGNATLPFTMAESTIKNRETKEFVEALPSKGVIPDRRQILERVRRTVSCTPYKKDRRWIWPLNSQITWLLRKLALIKEFKVLWRVHSTFGVSSRWLSGLWQPYSLWLTIISKLYGCNIKI